MSTSFIQLLRLRAWDEQAGAALAGRPGGSTRAILTFGAADAVRFLIGGATTTGSGAVESPGEATDDSEVLREVQLREAPGGGDSLTLAQFWDQTRADAYPIVGMVICRVAAPVTVALHLTSQAPLPVGFGGAAAHLVKLRQSVIRAFEASAALAGAPMQFAYGVFAGASPEVLTVLVRGRSLADTLTATDVLHRAVAPSHLLGRLRSLLGAPVNSPPEALFEATTTLIGMEVVGFDGLFAPSTVEPHPGHDGPGGFGVRCGSQPNEPLGVEVRLHTELRARAGEAGEALAAFRAMLDSDHLIANGPGHAAAEPPGDRRPPELRYPIGSASARATLSIPQGTTKTLASLLLSRLTRPRPGRSRAAAGSLSTVLSTSWPGRAPVEADPDAADAHFPRGDLQARLDSAMQALHRRIALGPSPAAADPSRAGPVVRQAAAALCAEPAEFTMLAALLEVHLQRMGEARPARAEPEPADPGAACERVLEQLLPLHPRRSRDPLEAWVGAGPTEDPALRESIERTACAVRLWSQRFGGVGATPPPVGGPVAIVLRGDLAAVHGRAITPSLFVLHVPARAPSLADLFLAPAYAEARFDLLIWPPLWSSFDQGWHRPVEELALTGYRTVRAGERLSDALDRIGKGITARAQREPGGTSLGLFGEVLRRSVALLVGLHVFAAEAIAAGVKDPRGAACWLAVGQIAGETGKRARQPGSTMRGAALVLLLCECAADLGLPGEATAGEGPPEIGVDPESSVAARVQRFMALVEAVRVGLKAPGCVKALSCATLPPGCAGADQRLNALRDLVTTAEQPWATALLGLCTDLGATAATEARKLTLSGLLHQLFTVVWQLNHESRPQYGNGPRQRFPEGESALRALTLALAPDKEKEKDQVPREPKERPDPTPMVLALGYDTGISALERLLTEGAAATPD